MFAHLIIAVICFNIAFPQWLYAETDGKKVPSLQKKLPAYVYDDDSSLSLTRNKLKKRNYIWPPIVSFFLPGFDQWFEGQLGSGTLYTGVSLLGVSYAVNNAPARENENEDEDKNNSIKRGIPTITNLKQQWGLQVFQTAGGLSAYHSFRTAVRSRLPHGQFSFLKQEESVPELLTAPFRFDYLVRWTTIAPLVLVGTLSLAQNSVESETVEIVPLSSGHAFFATAISYNAGTHEEALFRGWMMPMMMEWTDHAFLSNTVTAGVFALAHLSSTPIPLAQFLVGWWLGWITIKREWTLSEAIFIHTWWDVIVFTTQFQRWQIDPKAPEPSFLLPPLEFRF